MVSKTYELRKVITNLLQKTGKQVYYDEADNNATYPYIVYTLESVNFGNTYRDDILLTVDVWDRNRNSIPVENLTDEIEKHLNFKNIPNEKVLPTIFLEHRSSIQDPDKMIRRRQIKATIQNYYIGE